MSRLSEFSGCYLTAKIGHDDLKMQLLFDKVKCNSRYRTQWRKGQLIKDISWVMKYKENLNRYLEFDNFAPDSLDIQKLWCDVARSCQPDSWFASILCHKKSLNINNLLQFSFEEVRYRIHLFSLRTRRASRGEGGYIPCPQKEKCLYTCHGHFVGKGSLKVYIFAWL